MSMNIYDSDSRIVRELMHGEHRSVGANSVEWNGRDNAGNRLPNGDYTFKLLATRGLKAKYVMNLGTTPNTSWEQWPGNYGGIYAVCCDGKSIYFGSCGESTIMLVKQSLAGKRDWIVPTSYEPWQGPIALGRSTDKLFMLQPNGMVYRIDADTSDRLGRFNAAWNASAVELPPALTHKALTPTVPPSAPPMGPSSQVLDLAANDDVVAISYYDHDSLRWYQPGTGRLLDQASIPHPLGIAIDKTGRLFVITNGTIVTLSRSDKKPRLLIDNVPDAYRLAIDPQSGDVLVAERGRSQQVARYSASGQLVTVYGALSGRMDGKYKPESFSNVTDVSSDGAGGFVISEADAPRRVSRFDSAGHLAREWIGPQTYAPYAEVDSKDASTAWGDSDFDHLIQYRINLADRSWSVAGVYSYGDIAKGMFSDRSARPKGWHVRHHDGETFLVRANPFRMLRADSGIGYLAPVATLFSVDRTSRWKVFVDALVSLRLAQATFLWTDQNGNGQVDAGELTAVQDRALATNKNMAIASDMTVVAIDGSGLHKLAIDQWLPGGIPQFGKPTILPLGHGSILEMAPETPAIDDAGYIWSIFDGDDGSGRTVRGVVRWDENGLPTFKVGVTPVTANSARYLTHIVGTTHGCIAAADPANSTVDVWDEYGLWVGQFFDAPDFAVAPRPAYRLNPHFLGHSLFTDSQSGEVSFLGSGVNNNPVIKISGWDDWDRIDGSVELR